MAFDLMTPPTTAPGRTLTPMPCVQIELGEYVVVRARKDGTFRVLFEAPARLRPSGWSPTIPLPVSAERADGVHVVRRGDLADELEVRAIREDAAMLYARLRDARLGRAPAAEAPRRNMATLSRSWQATQTFKAKKPRTQKGYAYYAGVIVDWWTLTGSGQDRLVERFDAERVEKLLALYDDRPTDRRHIKIVLKMLLDHAIRLDWIARNPAAGIRIAAPKVKLRIWERDDALAAAWVCLEEGQPAIAALILTEWEIGQRLTDARMFRWGGEYQPEDGAFRFWQAKTQAYIAVHVSAALRALLAHVHDPASLYLFVDAATGRPFAEQRLSHVWDDIRTRRGFDPRLQIRTLRHSCVVQLARCGVDIPGIASITGHALQSVYQILQKYLPADNILAWQAQVKRGLITEADVPAPTMIGHNSRGAG